MQTLDDFLVTVPLAPVVEKSTLPCMKPGCNNYYRYYGQHLPDNLSCDECNLIPIPTLEREPSIDYYDYEAEDLIADAEFPDTLLTCTAAECEKQYYYNDSDPSYPGVCFECEGKERLQDYIDSQLYPDDIPDHYRCGSDSD